MCAQKVRVVQFWQGSVCLYGAAGTEARALLKTKSSIWSSLHKKTLHSKHVDIAVCSLVYTNIRQYRRIAYIWMFGNSFG